MGGRRTLWCQRTRHSPGRLGYRFELASDPFDQLAMRLTACPGLFVDCHEVLLGLSIGRESRIGLAGTA